MLDGGRPLLHVRVGMMAGHGARRERQAGRRSERRGHGIGILHHTAVRLHAAGEESRGLGIDYGTILVTELHLPVIAAEACAEAGSLSEAVTISMDIEQLIYEAGRLHDAASLLNRLSQD